MVDGNESPTVKVTEGLLQGRYCVSCDGGRYASFQGIPYAKPPLGNLRFMPPEPAEKWSGIRDATKEGSDCYARSLFTNAIVGSEDCLYLNVYTPQVDSKKRLPVMFWIHGGGFVRGSGSSELFGPDYLVGNNVVLITVNYRLGHLGFLAFPNPEVGVTGNAGLKDIVLALKWVKKNIIHLGGDPNNVTIFGESAGGSAVHLLVLSSKTKGLFHKAIFQSGTALNNFSRSKFAYTYEVARNLGIESNSDKLILSEMQKVSIDELSQACYKIRDPYLISHIRPFCPVIEPKTAKDPFLTEEPLEIIKSGRYNQVPMLTGYNSFEGIFFYTYVKHSKTKFLHDFGLVPHTLNLRLNSPSYKNVAEKIRKLYDIKGNESKDVVEDLKKALKLYGHNSFAADVYRSAKLHCQNNKHPVYFYRLNLDTQLNFVKRMSGVTDEDKGMDIPQDTGVIEATAVLKSFLRNLPGRLIPKSFTKIFHQAAQIKNNAETYNLCILLLPLYNIYLLLYLMQFFNQVTQFSSDNKMNSYNMAVVIGPNLFAETKQSESVQLNLSITKVLIEQAKSLGHVSVELSSKIDQADRKGDFPGAAHGDDLGYLFTNNFTDSPQTNTLEHNLIRKIVKLWTNFAYYGNPTQNPVEEVTIWNPVTLKQFNYLSLDNDEFRPLTDPDKIYMEFWDKLYLEHQVHLSKL